jgi:hypothetical protein
MPSPLVEPAVGDGISTQGRYLIDVCRSSNEPGGPRNCPAHARARYRDQLAKIAELQQRLDEYTAESALPVDVSTVPLHTVPPPDLSPQRYDELWRWGIRAWGAQTVNDYPLIAEWAGDVERWGFEYDRFGWPLGWHPLEHGDEQFLAEVLTDEESSSLVAYTCGWSSSINAAITADEPPPVDPDAKQMAGQILSALDKFAQHSARPEHRRSPALLVRGAGIPPSWHDRPQQFFDEVFAVGSRYETGAVTSSSLSLRTALEFAQDEHSYLVVIMTDEGLPLSPIGADPFEDETVLGPGQYLRTVHADPCGIAERPTVFLVSERFVARAQAREAHQRAFNSLVHTDARLG